MSTQDLEKFIQDRRREGRQEAMREDVIEVFTERFGPPPEDVASILGRTQDLVTLRGWLKLVVRASKEEALAAIRSEGQG